MAIHLSLAELEAGLDVVRSSPADGGTLELIVRRPSVGEREVLDEGELDVAEGLVGDTWSSRPSKKTADGGPHPEMQLNVMNARAALLVAAGDPDRRALAGDQLYLDLDLSEANLPPGTRLAIGDAVIEITAEPHSGCAKFSERFGVNAVRFVNSHGRPRAASCRGINAKVVTAGHDPPGRRRREGLTHRADRRSGHAHHHRLQPRRHADHRHGPHGRLLRAGLRRRRSPSRWRRPTTTRG